MGALRKPTSYQILVLLGLGTLVLLLLALTAANNWAMYGHGNDLRERSERGLTTVALNIAARLENSRTERELVDLAREISGEMAVHTLLLADSALDKVVFLHSPSSAVTQYEIRRQLVAQSDIGPREITGASDVLKLYEYIRPSESFWEMYHCPIYAVGSWRVLVVTRETQALANLERVSRIFLIAGAITLALALALFAGLFRSLTGPMSRIRRSVATVHTVANNAEEAVDELVGKYQQTIENLRQSEKRLLVLNERLADKVSDGERLNRYLLHTMSTGVIILGENGSLVGINERARELLGVSVTEQIAPAAKAKEDYVGLLSSRPEIKKLVDVALTADSSEEHDTAYFSEDGSMRTLRISTIPLSEDGGQLRELVILVADRTELVRAERQLEDRRRLASLGEMSAGLAHQLRNSLAAAIGYGSLAKRRVAGVGATSAGDSALEKISEPLEALLKELDEETALVDRFLSFARPLEIAREQVALAEFIDEVLRSYQVRKQTLGKVVCLVPKDVTVELDPLLMKQVIVNLVDNALTASIASDQPVYVSASRRARETVIFVCDDGPGVALQEREKIFTPFYSASPSGEGLGLPLARKIVELHGGTLVVGSPHGLDNALESMVSGAVFEITLPDCLPSEREANPAAGKSVTKSVTNIEKSG